MTTAPVSLSRNPLRDESFSTHNFIGKISWRPVALLSLRNEVDCLPGCQPTNYFVMQSNEATPNTTSEPLAITQILSNREEAETSIEALLCVCSQAVHSNSGDLMPEDRNHISWCLYLVSSLVKDLSKLKN